MMNCTPPARRSRRSQPLAYASLLASALASATHSHAAAPGVPALGGSAAGYVEYAVDSLPQHFTGPGISAFDNTPIDNAITDAGAELGRVLFYDPRLSHNDGTSCASCHTQATGFTDSEQFSEGFEGGLTGRHSMGLSNARWYESGRFFWDERAATLEDQVLGPIQDAVEMGSDLTQLVSELNDTEYYPVLFERAFGDSNVTSDRMAKAMAQFVRSMASYQSPFDRAVAAGSVASPNFAAVDDIENPTEVTAGHALFQQECAGCHRTVAQAANETHNIGLPRIDADGDGELDSDDGAGDQQFKVPSLRNIAMRGRFMHDGRFQTLAEVVEFYSSGVTNNGDRLGVGLRVGGFGFSETEKAALVAFLESLTDEEFLMSELFSNPLVALDGDYDGSGVVDDDDRLAWAAQFGLGEEDVSGPLMADGNGDGVVDAADYSIWRDNLGTRWDDAVAALAQAVPEPSTWLLAMLALATPRRRARREPLALYSPNSSV
ncbi:Cytochrome c551 peroxidase precursor [Planctomycetes bacterium MalM25]|nr:Cytochrome c551 peroxidase precursor [Planctomycetes bacterium MalM25]